MVNFRTQLRWGQVFRFVQNIDGHILLVGLIAISISLWIDELFWKSIFTFVFCTAVCLFILSIKFKQKELTATMSSVAKHSDDTSEVRTSEEENEMKKLVFDDFQSDRLGKCVVEEIDDVVVVRSANKTVATQTPKEEKKVMVTKPLKPEAKQAVREFQVSDFFDVNADVYKGGSEPRTEFDYLLNKVLAVIKEVTFAHTVAFFWANQDKQQMVCEEKITDSHNFLDSRRFNIGHDIVSKIALQSKPEIITRVNPVSEHELIAYYSQPQFIKSFVGVPVFFKNVVANKSVDEAVAVVAIDSKTEEAFGYETLLLLGQCTKLISGLIKSYTDKYDLLLDAELLNAIHRFQEKIKADLTVSTISQSLVDESTKLLKWDFISVVMQDEVKQTWAVQKVINRSGEIYIRPDTTIDFYSSIVGDVIKNNSHKLIEDLGSQNRCRYFEAEKINNSGSFISIPISSMNKCYGALTVESKDKYNFSKQDIEVLYRLTENAAAALEVFYMNKIIDEYVIVDELTGVYSKKFWNEKFNDELSRADDFGEDLSLLFLSVDNYAELLVRYGQNCINHLLVTLSKVIRSSVRQYDLVGRLDKDRFGIALIRTPANEAYLWAEKIRKTIASVVVSFENKSFSVTLSIGVSGASEGMTKDELTKNTSLVLHKATESGGNTVRVF